jgi:oxaloacetate decarboxylase gamma subunit
MSELLSQGLNLTLFGMGTVIVFLTLLILVTQCMSAIVLRFEASSFRGESLNTDSTAREIHREIDEPKLRSVIAAAIKEYRSRQG